jgi:hypothetical protein
MWGLIAAVIAFAIAAITGTTSGAGNAKTPLIDY